MAWDRRCKVKLLSLKHYVILSQGIVNSHTLNAIRLPHKKQTRDNLTQAQPPFTVWEPHFPPLLQAQPAGKPLYQCKHGNEWGTKTEAYRFRCNLKHAVPFTVCHAGWKANLQPVFKFFHHWKLHVAINLLKGLLPTLYSVSKLY